MIAPTALATAESLLLAPSDLNAAVLNRLMGRLLPDGADDADIYLQHSVSESWFLEDGVVKSGGHHTERGA
ncbi:DNA gyrase modulator, partial [Parvimonas micra]|uniref:PmbA/TldA family metallopeptidase n=1 Tax=Parvimonas micra TaxID=33033 RepID=UPI002B469F93